jgi:hypothetical protein
VYKGWLVYGSVPSTKGGYTWENPPDDMIECLVICYNNDILRYRRIVYIYIYILEFIKFFF